MRMIKRSGQSVAEYAIVFGVVAAAVIGMQVFVKRGLQAKERDVVKHFTGVTGGVGSGAIGTTSQYEPYYAASDYAVTQGTTSKEELTTGGGVKRDTSRDETKRTGSATTDTTLGADATWQ